MKYSFTWNGTTSGDKGIVLSAMPEIVRPEERLEHVTIPGRAGDLTQTEGSDVYNAYIVTIPIAVKTKAAVIEAESWLRGDGYLTLCNESDKMQRARVTGTVTFKKHSRNSDWWEAEVQFYCQPLKQLVTENAIEVTTSGSSITNPGDVEARPRITITGSGTVTVRIGTKEISITGAQSGWKIDSDTEWVTNASDVPQTGVFSGTFPTIPVGQSTVLFTGATKVTIEPRWRYL